MILLIALLSFAPLQDQPVGQPKFKVLDLVFTVKDLETTVRSLEVKETDTEIRIELAADVLFDFDKSNILPKAEQTLIASGGRDSRAWQGHRPHRGPHRFERRRCLQSTTLAPARRFRRGMAAQAAGPRGAASSIAEGFGATKPVAPNTKPDGSDDPEGRQKNRRVEIIMSKT